MPGNIKMRQTVRKPNLSKHAIIRVKSRMFMTLSGEKIINRPHFSRTIDTKTAHQPPTERTLRYLLQVTCDVYRSSPSGSTLISAEQWPEPSVREPHEAFMFLGLCSGAFSAISRSSRSPAMLSHLRHS